MFVSGGNSFAPPIQQSLVATQIPNSIALRVPPDNVSPSVSSAQLDNNASGNNMVSSLKSISPSLQIPVQVASASIDSSFAGGSSSVLSAGQAGFLAQLASGEVSPVVHGIFVQYEKLMSYGTVKYKPSDAGKPTAPASLFSAILTSEQPAAAVQQSVSVVKSAEVISQNQVTQSALNIEAASEIMVQKAPIRAYKESLQRNKDIGENA